MEDTKIIRTGNLIVLDIETTGLDPKTAEITCIGILKNKKLILFLDSDEKNLLLEFLYELSIENTFITFNGKKFDIPFIIERLRTNGFKPDQYESKLSGEKIKHIDLYEIRKNELAETGMKKFCNLTSVCNDYGIYVPNNFSSEHLARIFKDEKEKFTAESSAVLILHNSVDIYSIYSLYNQMYKFGVITEENYGTLTNSGKNSTV